PAYRFSTAPRESHVDASDTPGPGQYGDLAADGSMWRRFTGVSFPTESRFTTGKETDVILPGPGQYSPQHPQWNASQVYSFPSGKKEFLSETMNCLARAHTILRYRLQEMVFALVPLREVVNNPVRTEMCPARGHMMSL
ncbi:hypothetical protein TcCL_Unassigned06630, partial [Trypanosoma cruzi]